MKSRRHEIGLNDLSLKDRQVLEEKITENMSVLFEQQMRQTMITSIEMSMIILDKYFHFDKEQLLIYMGMYKMEFPAERKAVSIGEQREIHRQKLQELVGDGDIVEKFLKIQLKEPVIRLV